MRGSMEMNTVVCYDLAVSTLIMISMIRQLMGGLGGRCCCENFIGIPVAPTRLDVGIYYLL